MNEILLEVLVGDLIVEGLVQLLLLQFFEKFDGFLSGCPDGLVLVDSADIQNWQEVVDVAGNLVLEVGSDGIECVDRDTLRLSVLRLLDLLDKVRQKLLVVILEINLNVKNE